MFLSLLTQKPEFLKACSVKKKKYPQVLVVLWFSINCVQSQNGSGWKGHVVQPPCSSRYILEHKIASRGFLNICSEGDSTNFLGNLFQCVVTHTVKNSSLYSKKQEKAILTDQMYHLMNFYKIDLNKPGTPRNNFLEVDFW